ncbi:hypothetical protein AEA00_17580 [Xanthomonas campestris pv. campestris]|nr:hypothetical protein AEA00_17580 [Xanthomonas campestris pv. campestris]
MFGYYFNLAVRSFRRNKVLTALMVLAIALGIGASMTTLTVFYVLSGDPIPQLTRFDAETLLREKRAKHQAMMTRYTSADFFPMFATPFLYGLNDKLFDGGNSVGRRKGNLRGPTIRRPPSQVSS